MSVKTTKIYSLIPLYYTSNYIEVYNYSGWNVPTKLNGEGLAIRHVKEIDHFPQARLFAKIHVKIFACSVLNWRR
jgi:hypothetical protein